MNNCKPKEPGCNNQPNCSEFELPKNVAEAIDRAIKKPRHPKRIAKNAFKVFGENLLKYEEEISTVKNFHELIQIVRKYRVFGIGPLTIYDVAVCIGNFLTIVPKMVYLHAGVITGAKNYFNNEYKEVIENIDGFHVIKREHFLPKFEKLTCDQIEIHLCVNKSNPDKLFNP